MWAVTIIGGIASGVAAEGSIWLKQWLPPFLESGIAGGILIAIGIRSWNFSSIRSLYYQALLEKEWWFLSIALSLNNIGLGLTGGLLGFHPVIFGLSIGLTSGVALWIGSRIGEKLGKTTWQRWINPLSSLLLIGMGVYQFFRMVILFLGNKILKVSFPEYRSIQPKGCILIMDLTVLSSGCSLSYFQVYRTV